MKVALVVVVRLLVLLAVVITATASRRRRALLATEHFVQGDRGATMARLREALLDDPELERASGWPEGGVGVTHPLAEPTFFRGTHDGAAFVIRIGTIGTRAIDEGSVSRQLVVEHGVVGTAPEFRANAAYARARHHRGQGSGSDDDVVSGPPNPG